MRVSRDAVLSSIKNLLPDMSVNIGESEIDYIGGLDEPYRGLAILQAALAQVFLNGGPAALEENFRKSIAYLSEEISATEMKAYYKKQAPVTIYGEFQSTKWDKAEQVEILNDNNLKWTFHDCEFCRDTGWIVNYQGGKKTCICDKGLLKKKQVKQVFDVSWKYAPEKGLQKQLPVQKEAGPPDLPKKGRKFR